MKRIVLLSIIMFLVIGAFGIVNAAASISTTRSTMEIGETVTVTVSFGQTATNGSFNLSYDRSKFAYVSHSGGVTFNSGSGGAFFFGQSMGSVTFTFSSIAEGSGSFSASGIEINEDVSLGSTGARTVTVQSPPTPAPVPTQTPVPTPSTNTDNNQNKSNNANITGLTLSVGQLEPAFNKNTKTYTVQVGSDVTEINITPRKEDSKATVSISGNKNLKVGENTVTVTITAENGTTKNTYTIIVIREQGEETVEETLLEEAIERALEQLQKAFELYDRNDYTEEAWSLLEATYEAARKAIEEADSIEDIEKELEKALKAMAEIEVKEEVEETKKEISNTVKYGLLGLFCLGVIIVVIIINRRRTEEEK